MTISPLAYEVAHCSSWDDDRSPEQLIKSNPANRLMDGSVEEELSNVKVKGWQTKKCPTYPQDLIIHLLCGPARIAKIQLLSHHYKIATKVDIYIGLLKEMSEDLSQQSDDDDDTLIEFTRLGYICFDNNARAQYRARELKSIKINADGEYIRLVIRNSHQNGLNTYNQVGVLALNVLGQPLMHSNSSSLPQHHMARNLHSLDDASMLSSSTRRTSVSSTHSLAHELSTSGVVELELQHWTSSLAHAETLAVRDEDYQTAKTYKFITDRLVRFSKLLADFEQAKRQAVDTKDYDEAEKIKGDINEVKQAAEMIIKQANIRITDDGQVIPLDHHQHQRQQQQLQPMDLPTEDEEPMDTKSITVQDEMIDETIAKWKNFDVTKPNTPEATESSSLPTPLPSSETVETETVETAIVEAVVAEDVPHNMMPSLSTASSARSVDLNKMLMPPYWTSYQSDKNGHDDDGNEEENDRPLPILSSSMSAKIQRRKSMATDNINNKLPSVPNMISLDEKEEEDEEEEDEDEIIDPDAIPEPIMDEERGAYYIAIDVFSEDIVACVLSIKSKCRERGLQHIQRCVDAACQYLSKGAVDQLLELFDTQEISDQDQSPSAYLVNASLMMVQEAVMDSREPIVTLAIQIWQQLNDFYLAANVDPELTMEWMSRTFSGLLKRTGDANTTIRSNAVDLVLILAHSHQQQQHGASALLDQFICKPERTIHQHKEASARILLVQRAVDELKLESQGGIIALEPLMAFVMAYLYHGHDGVQQEALRLLLVIASSVEWKQLSPLLDDTTRRTLQSKLKLDSHLLPNKENTMAELRALTVQSGTEKKQVIRKSDINGTKRKTGTTAALAATDKKKTAVTASSTKKSTAASNGTASTKEKRTQRTTTNSSRGVNKNSAPANDTQDAAADSKENSMCIFCDEYNENFNEQTLITHYYKSCPALTNCPMCQIILEVSTLQSHTVTDCEKRHLMKQCTRCKQAIPVEQWLQHTLKNACAAYTNPDEVRCPLCLVTIEPGNEEGWRRHLLTGEGCPKNQRRQQQRDTTNITTTTTTTTTNNTTTTTKKLGKKSSSTLEKKPSSLRMKQSSLKKK